MKTMHLYCGTEKKPLKQALLNEMSKHDCFFDAIYEIINNLFLKNLKFKRGSISQRRKIKSFLPVLHKIKKKPKNRVIRRKLVNQTGGFIQFVLPVLTAVVGGLISDAFSKKSDTSTS